MNIKEILHSRYSTKSFDPSKKISAENMEQVKELLQMAVSSTNLQPWHFIISESEEGKNRIAKAAVGHYSFNIEKVTKASAVIVLCAKQDISNEYMLKLLEKEERDGRYQSSDIKDKVHQVRMASVENHRNNVKDLEPWLEKQVYINMGSLVLGLAAMGIDALPMEGLDMGILNQEFSLEEKGLKAVAVVSLGYRLEEEDFNVPSKMPKSRLNKEDIITII